MLLVAGFVWLVGCLVGCLVCLLGFFFLNLGCWGFLCGAVVVFLFGFFIVLNFTVSKELMLLDHKTIRCF